MILGDLDKTVIFIIAVIFRVHAYDMLWNVLIEWRYWDEIVESPSKRKLFTKRTKKRNMYEDEKIHFFHAVHIRDTLISKLFEYSLSQSDCVLDWE